jgi:hypothetical protein
MKGKIQFIIALSTLLLFISTGCKRALDINESPNVAVNATPELLLPSAEVQIASAVGVDMQIYGSFWAQYWTQSPTASQYRDIERYAPAASDFDRLWILLYSGALKDLQQTQTRAAAEGRNHYVGIAKLLTAYTFQMITDAWGDVPFSEALQGGPSEGLILSPKYDKQEFIYDNIIKMVDTGISLLKKGDPNPPGSDDLIYGGDADTWTAFGNSLKLRMLLRISYVDPGRAATEIAALTGPFLDDPTIDAQVAFSATAGNRNPLAAEIQALNYTTNAVASKTSIDSFLANNDPRIDVFYEPSEAGQIGLQQGDYNATPGTPISQPGAVTGANSNLNTVTEILAGRPAAVKLLTSYETYFLRAEATARNFLGGDAQVLFEQGIRANFSTYGLPDSAADDYITGSYWGQYPTGGDEAAQVKHIITQKWFSMNGTQGFEAWTEKRRTGYPDFLVISKNSLIGSNRPVRFFYPSVELTRNQNFPGQKAITDKVWWDVKD